jgi:ligand-binding SRPBCC domain-containing protein
MAIHVLERSQLLRTTLSEAWDFFSTPKNLARITPSELGFSIRAPFDDRPAYTGQLVTYSVKPLFGIPLTWVTRIEEVQAPYKFVDTQLRGPYKRWWHEHVFEEVEGGVLMRDRVEYELPLGPLGVLMHDWVVKGRLKRIFDHRWTVLAALFGPATNSSTHLNVPRA